MPAHRATLRIALSLASVAGVLGLPAAAAAGAFPGNNGLIVFSCHLNSGTTYRICSMNPDGSSPLELTSPPAGSHDAMPAVSADGTKVAFVRRVDSDPFPTTVWVMSLNGSGQVQVTSEPSDDSPTWTPGGRVVYTRESDQQTRSVSATGTGDAPYPGAPANGGVVGFDSAGVYAYNKGVLDGNPGMEESTQLFTSAGTQVTALVTYHVELSSWSPDGSKLAFETNWSDHGNNIDIAPSDGSNQATPTKLDGGARHPAWSPDGAKIAYAKEGGTIVTMPAAGGTIQTITPAWATAPSAPYYIEPDWAETGGPNLQALTVAVGGTGSGTVTGPGISCPSQCANSYSPGTLVTLTATPQAGSSFAGWSGACSGAGACTVTMNVARSVTATFAKAVIDQGGSATKTTVTESAKGDVTLPIENPNGVQAQGDLKLVGQNLKARVVAAKKKKGKKKLTLGHSTFTVPAHGTVQVKVHLSKKARAYLKKHKTIKAKATIVLTANGTSKTSTPTVTIKAPKKKHKK